MIILRIFKFFKFIRHKDVNTDELQSYNEVFDLKDRIKKLRDNIQKLEADKNFFDNQVSIKKLRLQLMELENSYKKAKTKRTTIAIGIEKDAWEIERRNVNNRLILKKMAKITKNKQDFVIDMLDHNKEGYSKEVTEEISKDENEIIDKHNKIAKREKNKMKKKY